MKNPFKGVIESFKSGMEQEQQTIAKRRENAITTMHLTDTLYSLTGTRDINPPLKMAIRLMACGVDPQDMHTIDTIGMAYAQGKFNQPVTEPLTEDQLQDAIDSLNGKEKKS